jgi:hypothetical protein
VIFDAKGKQTLIRRLAECFDALGAQRLLDHATVLHDRNLLQIRFECAIGCVLRERAFVTKGGCFTAGVTLSHVEILSYNDSGVKASFQRHEILPYNATLFKISC